MPRHNGVHPGLLPPLDELQDVVRQFVFVHAGVGVHEVRNLDHHASHAPRPEVLPDGYSKARHDIRHEPICQPPTVEPPPPLLPSAVVPALLQGPHDPRLHHLLPRPPPAPDGVRNLQPGLPVDVQEGVEAVLDAAVVVVAVASAIPAQEEAGGVDATGLVHVQQILRHSVQQEPAVRARKPHPVDLNQTHRVLAQVHILKYPVPVRSQHAEASIVQGDDGV
mmetsp:Transcript_8795/g.17645  ORF Transcript_8795/g.17645 Transcript_8795/m.17645 type:complete len:222 (+) Transcript_8795:1028-1693(+)